MTTFKLATESSPAVPKVQSTIWTIVKRWFVRRPRHVAASSYTTIHGKSGLGALAKLKKEITRGRRRQPAPALLDFRPTRVWT